MQQFNIHRMAHSTSQGETFDLYVEAVFKGQKAFSGVTPIRSVNAQSAYDAAKWYLDKNKLLFKEMHATSEHGVGIYQVIYEGPHDPHARHRQPHH